VLEGVVAATVGSLLAVGTVTALVQFFVQGFLAQQLPFTSFVGIGDALLVAPVLVLAGILVAWFSSLVAIRRYLRI
jgi:cell division transport system permease protein